MRPKVGLALGSGGLRGLAHIGVLRVLVQEGIPIDFVAGCSIGSLIGALYCSGQTPENMWKLAKHLRATYWLDFVVPKMGIIAGNKILDTINLLTRRKTFDQLNIPLAVVATEINSGTEIVFTEGSVAQAVRASISVPGIFVPYQINDMMLVDGAVLNPTPINVVRDMGADVVIAVDLAHAKTVSDITNIFDVIIQSIDIMERELFKHRQRRCEIMIRPEVSHISPSSFETVDECVALGETAARQVIPQIKAVIGDFTNGCRSVSEENPTLHNCSSD